MGAHRAIPGWFIDSTGQFQNQESKSILKMQCFKINIQYQEWHSKNQYQELISILEDWISKSISKMKIDCKKFKINIQDQECIKSSYLPTQLKEWLVCQFQSENMSMIIFQMSLVPISIRYTSITILHQ